jgi:hypothetical protein
VKKALFHSGPIPLFHSCRWGYAARRGSAKSSPDFAAFQSRSGGIGPDEFSFSARAPFAVGVGHSGSVGFKLISSSAWRSQMPIAFRAVNGELA